jgi:hypothetical protein
MKQLFLIIAFCSLILCSTFSSHSQDKQLDSLICQLNNQDIIVDGNYFGPFLALTNKSAIVYPVLYDSIVYVTEKLISLLDDSSKGIIVHYILSMKWANSYIAINYNENHIYSISLNQLKFEIDPYKNIVHTSHTNLQLIKSNWETWLKNLFEHISSYENEKINRPSLDILNQTMPHLPHSLHYDKLSSTSPLERGYNAKRYNYHFSFITLFSKPENPK